MNKKAFTLVELLAVIVLIGLIGVIVIPKIITIIENSRDNALEVAAGNMVEAAKSYFVKNEHDDAPFYEWETSFVTLGTLVDEGYIDEVVNGQTKEPCNETLSYVEIGKDTNGYIYNTFITCDTLSYKEEENEFAMDEYKIKYATKEYFKDNGGYPSDGNISTVTYSNLKSGGYITAIYDPIATDVECSGTGIVLNTSGSYTFYSGLICENYESEEYTP